MLSYIRCVGSGGRGGPFSVLEGLAREYGCELAPGFGGGGGGRGGSGLVTVDGLDVGRAILGGRGGIGGGACCGRGGAFCGCLEMTGGSFANISRRIARKSCMFDFYDRSAY